MKRVDNLLLKRILEEETLGEVFFSTIEGEAKPYSTKVYDREYIQGRPDLLNYLKAEITNLKILYHPNIIKLKEVKKSKRHFYLVMEYCNGGKLKDILDKYKEKNKCSFSEEIVQYIMRQIMSAMYYLHSNNIIHRDINLENILLKFDSEEDKKNLNIMKSQIKIINFGSSVEISKEGNPLNIDPEPPLLCKSIFKKLGYDPKIDVWSLGSICYEMLIGRASFDSGDIIELREKIEKGEYKIAAQLSREAISFLNGMLQYDSSKRMSIEDLIKHRFLIDSINNFHEIDLELVSDKIKVGEIEIDTKREKKQNIWSIFNKEEELNKIIPVQINQNH